MAIILVIFPSKSFCSANRRILSATWDNISGLKEKDNVTILTPYVPVAILGEEEFEGLEIESKEDGKRQTINAKGFFPLIGQNPNTQFVHIDGVLDEYKNIPVDKSYESINCKGLFAAGDVLPRVIKQIYLAEYDASKAAENIIKYLS